MKICFATNNAHKIKEVQEILGENFHLLSLQEIGCSEELPETKNTIADNSAQKAMYIWEKFRVACFADDSGLEVEILNNEPGVFSARYAGLPRNDEKNIELLLQNLEGKTNRKARFRTCITYIDEGGQWQFEGIVEGEITHQKRGYEGFGYDPVFLPNGFTQTFAEMSAEQKNQISHRAIAIKKLVAFLKNQ